MDTSPCLEAETVIHDPRALFFESSPDPLAIFDLNGTCYAANPALTATLRVTSGFIMAQVRTVVHPEDWMLVLRAIARLRRQGAARVVCRVHTPVGDRFWEISLTRANDMVFLAARDRTEEREREVGREALESQRREFVTSATHDLKTPLTTIRIAAQLLRQQLTEGTLDRERLQRDLERIDHTVTILTASINRMLDVARLDGQQPLNLWLRNVDLVELIRRVSGELAGRWHREVDVTALQPTIHGQFDAFRLERVLENLLSNAMKFSSEDSVVSVVIGADDVAATIRVHDTGIGIPSGELDRICRPFYRASNALGRVPGQGVGLASVIRTVKEHGGSMTIESEQGAGTVITIRLPLH